MRVKIEGGQKISAISEISVFPLFRKMFCYTRFFTAFTGQCS